MQNIEYCIMLSARNCGRYATTYTYKEGEPKVNECEGCISPSAPKLSGYIGGEAWWAARCALSLGREERSSTRTRRQIPRSIGWQYLEYLDTRARPLAIAFLAKLSRSSSNASMCRPFPAPIVARPPGLRGTGASLVSLGRHWVRMPLRSVSGK